MEEKENIQKNKDETKIYFILFLKKK